MDGVEDMHPNDDLYPKLKNQGNPKRDKLPKVNWSQHKKLALGELLHLTVEDEQDVLGVGWSTEEQGWTKVNSTMDSGCVDHVSPPSVAPNVPICPSDMSRKGRAYQVANGEDLPNMGEKTVTITTESGDAGLMKMQIAGVTKPLTSVSKLCDNNNLVVFGAGGGIIYNLATGNMNPFR